MSDCAIVLVPGLAVRPAGEARDLLTTALKDHAQSYRITALGDDAAGPASHSATHTTTGHRIDLSVHEIYWADLVPGLSEEAQVTRFKRGTRTFTYWIFGGWSRQLLIATGDRTMKLFMVWAAVSLLVWYLSLTVVTLDVLAQQFMPDATGEGTGTSSPAETTARGWLYSAGLLWQSLRDTATSTGVFGLLLLLSPFFLPAVRRTARMSVTMMLFLRDDPFVTGGTGFRTLLRHRIRSGLDALLEQPDPPRRIILVAHSLGAAAAVDALAELGRPLARIELHTWGGAFGVLTARDPLVRREIDRLMSARPGLIRWHDVVVEGDAMGSAVERRLPEEDCCPFDSVKVPRPRGGGFGFEDRHMFYFRSQDAVEALLDTPGPDQAGFGHDTPQEDPPGTAATDAQVSPKQAAE